MARKCSECGRRFETTGPRCPECGAATFVCSNPADLVGTTIDKRFTLVEVIGAGGMGAVFRARQHSMDRDVAVKVLRRDVASDEGAVRRFLREARAASRLVSPHSITVFDFGQTDDGLLYLAMELLLGRSLARLLHDEAGPVEPLRSVRIMEQVMDSLAEAHAAGVLHRDLKPDNLFVLEGVGRQDFVKVLDFGIAKFLEGDCATVLTGTGMAFGTPTYMSPEQAQARELDQRSDLYSAGVVLYEMLAGVPPFEGDTPLAVMLKKVQSPPPPLSSIAGVAMPPALDALVGRLLSLDPAGRPGSAIEVKALLARALEPVPAAPATVAIGVIGSGAATSPGAIAPAVPEAAVREESSSAATTVREARGGLRPVAVEPMPPRGADELARAPRRSGYVVPVAVAAVVVLAAIAAVIVAGTREAATGGPAEVPAPVVQAQAPAVQDAVTQTSADVAQSAPVAVPAPEVVAARPAAPRPGVTRPPRVVVPRPPPGGRGAILRLLKRPGGEPAAGP